ncbi:uncharacterized protein LOC133645801 isoform X1 [Entelurus aequoreus]|uniref:uncharacterized protein LOC133645801 isoform X1 n=1 Tax=Entelurus aequoreus TaxID=161455 RepID=UPI002B1D334A|nr:uncharacterized protein LOC133645801 isoform X1 [Entelurus aequoreus]XP_061896660.1 uncharacterized protein LOC133645801 isoform X1 [Entelurus aequoreus]XP_061896661.1 uncharacterized protein LOC133645801 isoform X1 [Entelurus aequoreus]
MPAGVSWTRYLRMYGASMLALFAGAQVVHQYYLPDLVVRESVTQTGSGVAESPVSHCSQLCPRRLEEVSLSGAAVSSGGFGEYTGDAAKAWRASDGIARLQSP